MSPKQELSRRGFSDSPILPRPKGEEFLARGLKQPSLAALFSGRNSKLLEETLPPWVLEKTQKPNSWAGSCS